MVEPTANGAQKFGFATIKATREAFLSQQDAPASTPEERVDNYRKHVLKRCGLALGKFNQPQRTYEEIISSDIQVGPEFDEIVEREDLIHVSGGDGSAPILSSFEDCAFDKRIYDNLRIKKQERPTLIQKCVIPLILVKEGFDVMATAATGSGKTGSFTLPIIQSIHKRKAAGILPSGNGRGPYALVISPTRELSQQLGDAMKTFARGMPIDVITSYGETSVLDAIRQLKAGCDILVSTPGRTIQFLREHYLNLENLKFFILDEADKLLQDQFIKDITEFKEALDKCNSNYRTLMFSATFDSFIQELASRMLKPNFFRASVISEKANIKQEFIQASDTEKFEALCKLLYASYKGTTTDQEGMDWFRVGKCLIFCNTRRRTNWLALKLAFKKIRAYSTNGDRTQQQRQEAKDAFERGDCDVLVSTNVTARGLNIVGIDCIINFELPKEFEDYVHRIGRTGRAGNIGRAMSFVDPQNVEDRKLALQLAYHLRSLQQPVPEFLELMSCKFVDDHN